MIVEYVDHEVRLPKCIQRSVHGEVCQDECRHQSHTSQRPSNDNPQFLEFIVLPGNEDEGQDTTEVEEKEVELHPENESHTYAHRERLPPLRHVVFLDEAQHVVEAVGQKGQRELFHAVAVTEEV